MQTSAHWHRLFFTAVIMQKLSRQVTVTNAQGLHARPADILVRRAKQFEAEINVEKEGNRVNGKSILDVLMLAAEEGSTLVIYAQGSDAEAALAALTDLFEQGFDREDEETANSHTANSTTTNSHTTGENLT
jgi:phosphocarrier protein HPr